MLVNDPIADMLTRIRNALGAKHDSILVPASNEKKAVAKILLDEFRAGKLGRFTLETAPTEEVTP